MKNVLIVDDQASIRQIVRLVLRKDFAITEAYDVVSALEQMKLLKPDGMVLDVMMPGEMDGYQLCEKIKQDPELADIHIVLLTACGQVADQEKGLALGANAYFVKPFSPVDLARHLTHALQVDK
ncbi:CheY FOG, CheY-like receiver [Methylophilaceae bacterium]|jgi:CheY-like chemotaxis protein